MIKRLYICSHSHKTEALTETTQKYSLTQTSASGLASLKNLKYLSLTAFRRSGEAIATSVWFLLLQHTLYLYRAASAGKIKRIRHTPQVLLAACTRFGKVTGPTLAGLARIVTDPQEQARAEAALNARYWLARRLLRLTCRIIHLFQAGQPALSILSLGLELRNVLPGPQGSPSAI